MLKVALNKQLDCGGNTDPLVSGFKTLSGIVNVR